MKKVFVIDWILIVVFIVSAISGIGLHIAGHGNSHEVWHNWAVVHVVSKCIVPCCHHIPCDNTLGVV